MRLGLEADLAAFRLFIMKRSSLRRGDEADGIERPRFVGGPKGAKCGDGISWLVGKAHLRRNVGRANFRIRPSHRADRTLGRAVVVLSHRAPLVGPTSSASKFQLRHDVPRRLTKQGIRSV